MPDIRSVEELIINPDYTSFVLSEDGYDNDDKENIPRIRKRILPTRELNTIIKQQFNFQDKPFILPNNCKFFKHYSEGENLLVIEEKPQVRTISVNLSMESTVEKLRNTGKLKLYGFEDFLNENERPFLFHLSFPYIIYFVLVGCENNIESIKIFYRLSPLNSSSDYLIETNFLNIGADNKLCLGPMQPENFKLCDVVDEAISSFWSNTFNNDITTKYRKYLDVSGVEDFLTWSYYTKLDPMFIFDVKWIPAKQNVNNVMRSLESDVDNLDFDIIDIFKHPTISNTSEPYIEKNITDSIVVGSHVLDIGESILYKNGKKVFINSFDGINGTVRNIQMEKWDGKLVNLKLTDQVKDFIEDQLIEKDYIDSAELSNGETFKVGDILDIDFPFKSFKEVEYIRIARDGKTEVKLGLDFYLLDTLQASILDENKIKFKGMLLEKNKEYILIRNYSRNEILSSAVRSKFIGVQASTDFRNVSFQFFNIDNEEEFIVDSRYFEIVSVEKLKPMNSEVFSIGSLLYKSKPNLYRYNNRFVEINNDTYSNFSNPTRENILSCVKEDRITVSNISSDTELKIGDEIVVADWVNLDEMLKVRKIESFEVVDQNIVYINAIDRNQERSKIPYIDVFNTTISIGYVRRIIDNYDGLIAGMKIKVKEKGISNFPLKDTNMIVGFLNDTGDIPLVLCSNGCTLWPDVVKNFFEIIPIDSPKWQELDVAPIEPNKIKAQAGDILVSYTSSRMEIPTYVLAYHSSWLAPKLILIHHLKDPGGYSMHTFNGPSSYKKYGFPSPRYTQDQMKYKPRIYGIPNMCNTYFHLGNYEISFPVDRGVENV